MRSYFYLLESIHAPAERYAGFTGALREELEAHVAGRNPHTAQHAPWRVVLIMSFEDAHQAKVFERYLGTSRGRALVESRFRSVLPVRRSS